MPRYSVAQAKDGLPKLIDQALQGEEVIITRRGADVAELSPRRSHEPRSVEQATDELRRRVAGGPALRIPLENFRAWLYDEYRY
jgi:antitoxin (DNA-binding transcriptional repressor) of toxin-antitoxin stability system